MPPEFASISVIIPAWRAAKTIRRALLSVAAQTLKPAQVVVVDDGSDDQTFEAAMACKEAMGGIDLVVIRQQNMGAGAARNRAIQEAVHPVLAFLDADDEWLEEKIERSIDHMEKGDHVLVAHNGWMVEDGRQSLIDGARRFRDGGEPLHSLYRKGYIDTTTVLARRDAVIEAGGFDTTLANGQDFDLWLKICKMPGATFEVFDDVLSRYHVMPESIMSHTGRRLECCLRIAMRHAPDLKARKGSAMASLWFRIVAVHYEALQVYKADRRIGAMLLTIAELPVQLLIMTMAFASGHTNDGGKFLPIFLWAWIGVAFAAYLFQFRHLAGPIMMALGLK